MLKSRKSGIAFLVIAVICGLVAAVMTSWLLASYARNVDVLVVIDDVEPFERLDLDMVGIVSVPVAAVSPDAILGKDKDSIEGRYTRFGLVRETVLRDSHLLDELGDNNPLAAMLSVGEGVSERAFAIPLSDEVAVGGAIEKEDHIDLIASIYVAESGTEETSVKVIARDVRVVDVVSSEDGVPSLIVIVTPRQAEELVFLLENGKLYAMLSSYDEDSVVDVKDDGFYTIDTFVERHRGSTNDDEGDEQ